MQINKQVNKFHDNENNLWFIISCKSIGGAERRILNLAHQVSTLDPTLNIKFLITEDLYKKYLKDTQLSSLVQSSNIDIYFAQWPERFKARPAPRNYLSILYILNVASRLGSKLRMVLARYSKLILNFNILKESSWLPEMLQYTKPGDHVHCFAGKFQHIGAILLSQKDRKVVIEVTSNRILAIVVPHLKCVLSNSGPCPNLHFNCISKTVYKNFVDSVGIKYLKKYQVTCSFYENPCLPIELGTSGTSLELGDFGKRENIIIFGHRFVKQKNGLLFAQIIADMYLNDELANWRIHFRGFGAEEEAIKKVLDSAIRRKVVDVGWAYNLEAELSRSKIFVSIIQTGSYPSQSVFQAMKNGNLLLLGDAGETVEKFSNKDIYFTRIKKKYIRGALLKAMSDADDSETFNRKSESIKKFFNAFVGKDSQAKELLNLHFQDNSLTQQEDNNRQRTSSL